MYTLLCLTFDMSFGDLNSDYQGRVVNTLPPELFSHPKYLLSNSFLYIGFTSLVCP